jgi:hypothetical protein
VARFGFCRRGAKGVLGVKGKVGFADRFATPRPLRAPQAIGFTSAAPKTLELRQDDVARRDRRFEGGSIPAEREKV